MRTLLLLALAAALALPGAALALAPGELALASAPAPPLPPLAAEPGAGVPPDLSGALPAAHLAVEVVPPRPPPLAEGILAVAPALPALPAPAPRAPGAPLPPEEHADLVAELAPGAPGPGEAPEVLAFPRDGPIAPFDAPGASLAPHRLAAASLPASAGPAPPRPAPLAAAPAAAAAAAGLGALLVAAAMYVRLAPSAALASPARQRIHDLVRADPGLTAGAVARVLGLDYKTALHHLRVLHRAGCVMVHPGAQPRYFASGSLPHHALRAAVVLRAPSARALLAALSQGPARGSELARALGLSETTASVQLRRLAGAGLAVRAADGRWAAA